ncbi:MAG: ribosome maturation factor RimM [Blastocatellia bacterium]|nr:ribosome maturation factor RimM [Blastocatellia bacterium]
MSAPPESVPRGDEELISIARIARPQGVRGEVIADLLTDFPERFAAIEIAHLRWPDGRVRKLALERARIHKGRVLLKFAGCDDRDEAEAFRDASVLVTREELVELPADTWYDFELVDCEVRTTAGVLLGKVVEIHRYGAAPLLDVRGEGREALIPLAHSICVEIDPANKRIVVDPPDGLLDL